MKKPMGPGGGYGPNTQFRLGGDQGGVKGMGRMTGKQVPAPDIKGGAYGRAGNLRVAGPMGTLDMGTTSNGEKKVSGRDMPQGSPEPDIKGRHLT